MFPFMSSSFSHVGELKYIHSIKEINKVRNNNNNLIKKIDYLIFSIIIVNSKLVLAISN
jgi:hypothetical protein